MNLAEKLADKARNSFNIYLLSFHFIPDSILEGDSSEQEWNPLFQFSWNKAE